MAISLSSKHLFFFFLIELIKGNWSKAWKVETKFRARVTVRAVSLSYKAIFRSLGKHPNPLEHLLRRWLLVPSNTKKEWYQLPGITPISLWISASYSVLFGCFQPLCGCFLTRNFYCQMREPAVLCCAMPMLHAGRNEQYFSSSGTWQILCPAEYFLPYMVF